MEFPMMDQGIEESMCNKVVYSVRQNIPSPFTQENLSGKLLGLQQPNMITLDMVLKRTTNNRIILAI